MKKLFLLLILMAVSVSYSVAAEVDTKAGGKDLVFSFNGLNTLGANEYLGGFGLRYYLQDDMALRPGINFTYSQTKDKTADPEAKTTTTGFGANLALEKHMSPAVRSISPYLGGIAGFNYDKTKGPDPTAHEVKTTTFNVGILAGFQWGFAEGMTLGGEYNFGVNIGSSKTQHYDTTTSTTVTDADASAIGFGISSASLMLSVHW
jgi:long-subunit fatty acid transport protein